MYQVQIPDQVYSQVKRRAVDAGFKSVDDYIVDVLSEDFIEITENLDSLFTPERLAHIDRSIAQIKAGEFQTAAQVSDHFTKRFEG